MVGFKSVQDSVQTSVQWKMDLIQCKTVYSSVQLKPVGFISVQHSVHWKMVGFNSVQDSVQLKLVGLNSLHANVQSNTVET